LKHPEASKNGGRIFIHTGDIRSGTEVSVGTEVEFFVYADARGLGAEDIGIASAGKQSNDAEGPLPEEWEKHWSAEHQTYYFWNQHTKETSWERPTGPSGGGGEDKLPPGWSKEFDSARDAWYWWHKPTRTAQWEKPEAPATQETDTPEPETEQAAEPEPAQPPADEQVLGQQRMQGIVTKWHGFFGWISPLQNLSEDLKALCERNQERIYVNWRDVKEGVNLKVGSHVSFTLSVDDNGLAAVEVRLHVDGEVAEKPTGNTTIGQAIHSEPATDEPSFGLADLQVGPEDDSASGPLLPGWEQQWSEEHQCNYYWHAATKTSSWERPCVPEDGDSSRDRKIWDGEGAEEGAAHLATPMTPLVSKAGRSMTPITPGSAKGAAVLNTAPANSANVKAPESAGALSGAPSVKGGAARPSFKGDGKGSVGGGNKANHLRPVVPWQPATKWQRTS
jgi:cold shock CspA family protein